MALSSGPLPMLAAVGRAAGFTVRAVGAMPHGLIRSAELLRQLERVGVESLPIVAAAGLSIGLVTWIQLHGLLAQVGSAALLPRVLAAAVTYETGPMVVALMAAGRVGAGLGAELGSMQITEQVDALAAMGVPPIRYLVATRVLACVIALPLLTVVTDVLAVLGGFAAEWLGGGTSWPSYLGEALKYLTLQDAVPATLKTLVFGLIIGVTGCYCGLSVHGGTEDVGRAATRSVVASILLVLAANVILVKLIQVLSH